MKSIFNSYGMKTLNEIEELKKDARNYLKELNGQDVTSAEIQDYISVSDCLNVK